MQVRCCLIRKATITAEPYLWSLQTLCECVGDIPSVVVPRAILCDATTGGLAIYYGEADTVAGLVLSSVDEIVSFVKSHPQE